MLSGTRADILKIIQALKPNTFVFLGVLNVEFYGGELVFSLMFFRFLFALCDVGLHIQLGKRGFSWGYLGEEIVKKISLMMWFYAIIMMLGSINYSISSVTISAIIGMLCLGLIVVGIFGQVQKNSEKLIVMTGSENTLLHKIARGLYLVDKIIDYKIESKGKEYLDGVKVKIK